MKNNHYLYDYDVIIDTKFKMNLDYITGGAYKPHYNLTKKFQGKIICFKKFVILAFETFIPEYLSNKLAQICIEKIYKFVKISKFTILENYLIPGESAKMPGGLYGLDSDYGDNEILLNVKELNILDIKLSCLVEEKLKIDENNTIEKRNYSKFADSLMRNLNNVDLKTAKVYTVGVESCGIPNIDGIRKFLKLEYSDYNNTINNTKLLQEFKNRTNMYYSRLYSWHLYNLINLYIKV